MTIFCNQCGEPPLSYVTINGINLCEACAILQYAYRLKALKKQYSGLDLRGI